MNLPMYNESKHCTACSRCVGRKNDVPIVVHHGIGARYMVITDCVSEEDTDRGVILCSTDIRSSLVDKILQKAGLSPQRVVKTSVVRCRGERETSQEAESACALWIGMELQIHRPLVILCFGNMAAKYLSISSMHTKPGIISTTGRADILYENPCVRRLRSKRKVYGDQNNSLGALVVVAPSLDTIVAEMKREEMQGKIKDVVSSLKACVEATLPEPQLWTRSSAKEGKK